MKLRSGQYEDWNVLETVPLSPWLRHTQQPPVSLFGFLPGPLCQFQSTGIPHHHFQRCHCQRLGKEDSGHSEHRQCRLRSDRQAHLQAWSDRWVKAQSLSLTHCHFSSHFCVGKFFLCRKLAALGIKRGLPLDPSFLFFSALSCCCSRYVFQTSRQDCKYLVKRNTFPRAHGLYLTHVSNKHFPKYNHYLIANHGSSWDFDNRRREYRFYL